MLLALLAAAALSIEPQRADADAPARSSERRAGALFERVADVLGRHYHDRRFAREKLPELVAKYRGEATSSEDFAAERSVVHAFLAEIPSSHLAVMSRATHEVMDADMDNVREPTLGFDLVAHGERFFVHGVLAGGPAARAGLLRGDRVLAIDGQAPERSPRLDWRSDDAHLDDPPVHKIRVKRGDAVRLRVERRDGEPSAEICVNAAPYSSFDAAKASACTIDERGRRFGYVHFPILPHRGFPSLLRRLLADDFRGCDGLLLDLRGRGGSAAAASALFDLLAGDAAEFDGPVAVLVDHGTRSAKEVLAYDLRRAERVTVVGERTAGAVLPATFVDVGGDSVLMFPSTVLDRYTDALEGRGVVPDVPVDDAGAFAAGADPILAAGVRFLASR